MFFCKPFLLIGLVILALGLLFNWGCCRRSCGGGHCGHGSWHGKGHGDWMVKKIAKALDLTGAQKAKLSAIKDSLMARRAELGGIRSGVLTELAAQARSEKIDQPKLNGLLEQKAAKARALHESLVAQIAEFHAMLSPEQREKLGAKLERLNDRQKKCSDH